jgi:protein AroM
MAVVGLVTIGQAPRDELAGELKNALPAGSEVVQSGALDRVAAGEISRLSPREADSTLTTTMRDGVEVQVDRDLLVPLVEDAIARVETTGCDVVVLMCTDEFPNLTHRVPLLHAGELLSGGVAGLAASMSTIGVIAPLVEQGKHVTAQWRSALDARVLVGYADPYSDASASLTRSASRSLVRQGVELLVLDCMGYRGSHRVVAAEAGVPVVLARSLVDRLVAEFVSGASVPQDL